MSFTSYACAKGTKQGQLKAGSKKAGRSDKWSEVIAFKMESSVAVDPKSGRVTGHRDILPLVITLDAGPWSPQLLQAHYTNEVLTEVIIEMVARQADGKKEVCIERITLADAVICKIERYSNTHGKDTVTHDVDHLEDISFVFRQITVENPIASTSVTEDYNTPGS
jgi:type VI secretion system Hcp family effector